MTWQLKSFLAIVSWLFLLISCGEKGAETSLAPDSLAAVDTIPKNSQTSQKPIIVGSDSAIDQSSLDTLYYLITKDSPMGGDFMSLSVITEELLDVNNIDTRNTLVAVIVQTGEGEYGGIKEDIAYETIHSRLAVFEYDSSKSYTLLSFVDLSETGGHALQASYIEFETSRLADYKDAILARYTSSEAGAGDQGYKSEYIEVYLVKDNRIIKVLEVNVYDYKFASNETDAMYSKTSEGKLTILTTKTNGLFDISLITRVSESGEEESEVSEETVETEGQVDELDQGGPLIYKWTGSTYVPGKKAVKD